MNQGGRPLSVEGMKQASQQLDVGMAELWSLVAVETRGCGFQADRRPVILFERHYFSRLTGRKFDAGYPDISNPRAGGYGLPSRQYDRLERAIQLDRVAALESASWGLGQIMGSNAQLAGFNNVEDMAAAMEASEDGQFPDLRVRTAQLCLTYHGFNPGTVDGVFGAKTRNAIIKFQAAHQLPQTGEPDDALLAALDSAIFDSCHV